jgi:hypothetical protein
MKNKILVVLIFISSISNAQDIDTICDNYFKATAGGLINMPL